jgi:hypothetical protein
MADPASVNWAEFIGRFHPLLVHAPIGLLLGLAVVEASLLVRRVGADPLRTWLLVATLVAGIGAVGAGWLLAEGGGYDEATLFWHRWLAVGLVVWCGLLLMADVLRWPALLYRAALGLGLVLISVVGHLGGNLTHGENYLFQHAPSWLKPLGPTPAASASLPAMAPVASAVAPTGFAAIEPILVESCHECHGATKKKGGLSFLTREAILAGGKSGPVVVPGKPDDSTFVTTTELPAGHDDLMPEGGPPLTKEFTNTLRRWVTEGALP